MKFKQPHKGWSATGATSLLVAVLTACGSTPSDIESLSSNKPEGVVQPTTAFAGLPFRKQDVGDSLLLSGEWRLDSSETIILGPSGGHEALDFQLKKKKLDNPDNGCGTALVAMFPGTVIASYQSGVIRGNINPPIEGGINEDWTNPETGRTGYLGFGGLLIELISDEVIPGQGRITAQYLHLEQIEDRFRTGPDGQGPWIEPEDQGASTHIPSGEQIRILTPVGLRMSEEAKLKRGVHVEEGEILARMGDTGINHGYQDDYDSATRTVRARDRMQFPAWDPCQVHIQLYAGRDKGVKQNIFDPLDHYGSAEGTPEPTEANPEPGKIRLGPNPLFRRDEDGYAAYAA